MAIVISFKNKTNWLPPIPISGGVLPNALPGHYIIEEHLNNLIKDMLPPLPKLPNVGELRMQALRYISSSLINDQYSVLIQLAQSGLPGVTALFITRLKWASMIPRTLP